MSVISRIIGDTLSGKGGCTYSLSDGERIIFGSPFYALSLHKELEEIIPVEELNETHIKMFIIKNSELLWQPNVAIGTWVNEEQVYLDVTTLFSKHHTSLEQLRAMSTDQLAAWDMETNEVINLNQ